MNTGGHKVTNKVSKGVFDIPDVLNIASEIAKQVGKALVLNLGNAKLLKMKTRTSLLIEQDLTAEHIIIDTLRQHFPDHTFFTEESEGTNTHSEYHWLIDPLDGSKNYVHGYPFFAISFALARGEEVLVSVVYNPVVDEMFTAQRNAGAYINGQRITVSKTNQLNAALFATNFHDEDQANSDSNIWKWARLIQLAQGIRTDGSAALDLCYVAAGRLDGFWSLHIKPWDFAAGALILTEAGGRVSDRNCEPLTLSSESILATNGKLHDPLAHILEI
jgi:myo-inositol-1(or 4)-monophosphatase